MKKRIAWLLGWSAFWVGDILGTIDDYMSNSKGGPLEPIFGWFLLQSLYIQEWGGGGEDWGPWRYPEPPEEPTDELANVEDMGDEEEYTDSY